MSSTQVSSDLHIREQVRRGLAGGGMLAFVLFLEAMDITAFLLGDSVGVGLFIGGGVLQLVTLFLMAGFIVVNPNEARVLLLFGRYVGTVKKDGWFWVNPFYTKQRISLRIENFETDRLKVNDLDGNPIEIAAIVVWRVVDTAEASFSVADYRDYVHVQSEAAVRNLATQYAYDSDAEDEPALRGHTQSIAEKLSAEIQERLDKAGVRVTEARISHLAYAPEIAGAMLQRQQAGAVIAARSKIVEGAVGMVEMALQMLAKTKVVDLDGEQRAAMVSNLLVVLCADRGTQPVVNTGTIYQ